MIATTLMLFSWIAGVFSNKKIDEETPEKNISSDNIPTIVQMDKDLDNEKPEVPMPEPLSNPENDAPKVEIENLIKILDAANYQLSRVAHLLAEADKPDESDDEGPPHSFAATEIRNQTEPDDDSDGEIEMATEATEEENVIPCSVLPLAGADLPQVASSSTGQEDWDAIVPESPSPAVSKQIPKTKSGSPKRFTFKVIKLPNLQAGCYLTLCLNERDIDGRIIKKKILSSRDPQWSVQKRFIFDVLVKNNPEDATITCKLKKKALFGTMTLIGRMKTTKLPVNNENIELLSGFKVAEIMRKKKSDQ
jgi:hypothetical protein